MSNDTTRHTPADVRELAGEIIRSLDLIARNYDSYEYGLPVMTHYDEMVDTVVALLRTPRGEEEASGLAECIITCMGCGQDFDANDDAQARYHEAACEVVDHEPARVEIARRLRGAALRPEAQGDAKALAALVVRIWTRCKNEGPHYRETDEFWADFERAYQLAARRDGAQGEVWPRTSWGWLDYLECLLEDHVGAHDPATCCDVDDDEACCTTCALYRLHQRKPWRAALRSEAPGEDRWEDLVFGPITEAYNEAHAARRGDGGGDG